MRQLVNAYASIAALPRKTVYRWRGHPACELGNYRKQSNDDHRRELLSLLHMVLVELRFCGFDLNALLLYTTVWHHDDGEDFLGNNILYALKSVERDVAEYRAFVNVMQPIVPGSAWSHLHRAFLLQFVPKHKDNPRFPQEARTIMNVLNEARYREAMVFEFIERFDYLLYALEQYERYENPHFVREVFPNQHDRLDKLTAELPALEPLWIDSGVRGQAREVLRQYGPLSAT